MEICRYRCCRRRVTTYRNCLLTVVFIFFLTSFLMLSCMEGVADDIICTDVNCQKTSSASKLTLIELSTFTEKMLVKRSEKGNLLSSVIKNVNESSVDSYQREIKINKIKSGREVTLNYTGHANSKTLTVNFSDISVKKVDTDKNIAREVTLNRSEESKGKGVSHLVSKSLLDKEPLSVDTSAKCSGKTSRFTDEFIPVDDNGTMFLYSAFFDWTESPNSIKVVSIVTANKPKVFQVVCVLCLNSGLISEVNGSVVIVPEAKYGYRYRSSLVTCPLRNQDRPVTIAVVLDRTSTPNNNIRVNYPKNQRVYKMTRCYPVLHSRINNITLILQSIEASRVLGTDHFVFYNHSVGPDVQLLLQHYSKQTDLVSILDWNLPVDPKDIHYWGQVVTLQDCLYRNLNTSRYILFADVDEILVPKKHPDWLSLLESFSSSRKNGCSAWIFQHAFFPTMYLPSMDMQWKNKTYNPAVHNIWVHLTSNVSRAQNRRLGKKGHATMNNNTLDMLRMINDLGADDIPFLRFTQHSRTQSMLDRSKYIVDPKRVRMLGVHGVNAFKKPSYCFVNEETALIHHYRQSWSNDMMPPWSHDFSILKFSESVIKSLQQQLWKLFVEE